MTELDSIGGKARWTCVALAAALLCSGSGAAQEAGPRTWWVHQVVADPAMKSEYEAAAKEFLQELDTSLSLRIDAVESTPSRYTFFATLDDSDQVEHDPQVWVSTLMRISREKTRSLEVRGLATASGGDGWLLRELPDLSYTPDGVSPQAPGFVRYTFNYVDPGREKAALRALRDLRELYEKREVASVIGVLQSARDDGALIYVVREGAENPAAFLDRQEELTQSLGGRGRSLRGKLQANLLRAEVIEGQRRPDLSYPASAMAASAKIVPLEPLPPEPPPAERAKIAPLEPLPPETTRPSPREDAAALEAAVRQWAEAWADQRVDDYLEAYSRDFWPPGGGTRASWEAHRRQRLTAPSSIEVVVRSLKVLTQGPGAAWVELIQEYRSDSYGDVVKKRLELALEDDAWKIVQEQAAPPQLPPAGFSQAAKPAGRFFVVLYSTAEREEAVRRAETLEESGFPAAVYASRTGMFAVVVRAASAVEQVRLHGRLVDRKLAPPDTYRSRGDGLTEKIYP